MIDNAPAKVMLGMSLIGDSVGVSGDERMVQAWVSIITGTKDTELRCAFSFNHYKCMPDSDEALADATVTGQLNVLKARIRFSMGQIFEQVSAEDRVAKEIAFRDVRNEVLSHSKPHAMGTVAEIAIKLGISKSEVRRRKQEGTL